jgi:alkylated DNA repair dioxygenase AlkB
MEMTALRDGGTLTYDGAFLEARDADTLFTRLRSSIPWREEPGRGRPLPRLIAWCADKGLTYGYAGVVHRGTGWPPTLLEVKHRVEEISAAAFNSLLLNLYRDGADYLPFHTDAEPELGVNPIVASVTLGSARPFLLRHNSSGEKVTLRLAHGSLLVMGGATQHHWQHSVPKTAKPVGERINLTFRRIILRGAR